MPRNTVRLEKMPTVSASSWVKFFTNAGIPSQAAAGYAHIFVENRIQMDMLMDLNKEYLREMGITTMGDIIAILRQAIKVNDQSARDRVLSSQVAEGPALPEHLAHLVPVAAVSATPTPKSVVSRPSSAVSLPSKSRKVFSEHKVTLPAGGSSANIVRTINEGSDKKTSLVSTVGGGSLGKRSAVFKRLESNSDDEKEDEEEDDDGEGDSTGNGREPPKKMASKVTMKGIEALGKRSSGGGSSIFSRLGEKSSQKDQKSEGATPTGILKKSPQQPARKLPPKSQNVILVKKIPAKAAADDDHLLQSSVRRSFERMNTDGEPTKSVSFSKEDEVLEIDPRPQGFISPKARMRFHERELPVRARLGNGPMKRRPPFPNQQQTTLNSSTSSLRGTKKTVHMKAGNVTTLSPASLARSKMKADAMLLGKGTPIRNRLSLGSSEPGGKSLAYRKDRYSLDSKLANLKLKTTTTTKLGGGGARPMAARSSTRPAPTGARQYKEAAGASVFDRLGYGKK